MVRPVAITSLLFMLIAGCWSKELTRPKVADLITLDTRFAEPVAALPLQREGRFQGKYDAGQVEGLWNITRSTGNITNSLTPKGRETFASDFGAYAPAPLTQPAKRELVEVTGITSPPQAGEGVRLATFTWRYTGLSDIAARYTGEQGVVHNGQAVFQLFDDGWRLRNLALNEDQGLVAFQWSPELQQQLYRQLALLRLQSDRGLELAKAALAEQEPVLNFSLHPAWNIPTAHGLTGQPLNSGKIKDFMALLASYHVNATGAGQPNRGTAYYQVQALSPPSGWETFERKPRYTNTKSYAVFSTSEVRLTQFVDRSTEDAFAEVEITYSGCTPACELANALQGLPNFDHGGKVVEKIFNNYPDHEWPQKVTRTVYFQRPSDGEWQVSAIR
jgi:hypothetical protein